MTQLYRAFALNPKRNLQTQFEDVLETCRLRGLSSPYSVVLDAHDAESIALPSHVSATTRRQPSTVLVAVPPEGIK